MNLRVRLLSTLFASAVSILPISAQRAPNANTAYKALRALIPGGDVITVKDFVLQRDAATFTFHSGSFAFYGPVNGKITGAVFKGEGHLHIAPPTAEERHNLSLLAGTPQLDENFDQIVLRFSDSTADDLRKASAGPGQPDADFARAAQELQSFLRHHAEGSYTALGGTFYFKKLYENLDLRLLEDVLCPSPGRYFFAAMHSSKNPHLFFIFDPYGIDEVSPEEVAVIRWDPLNDTETVPLAFPRAGTHAHGTAYGSEHVAAYSILREDLDVSIEKSGFLSSLATIELQAQSDGFAVVPLDLYPSLRVSQVTTDKGDPLDWVQEGKDLDPDFGVILAAPLRKGESTTIKITYGGNNVVLSEGGGNYYPVAREDWFPSSRQDLGDYASYHMLFHVPKGLQLVATGTKVNESNDGKITTTEWKTDTPLPVVGFSFGQFKMKEVKLDDKSGNQLVIDAYANAALPDVYKQSEDASVHMIGTQSATLAEADDPENVVGNNINTPSMLNAQLGQAQAAVQIYSSYFGPTPFTHLAVTQQFACTYGQSWPMLVFLPICAFLDQTQQHVMGLGGENLNRHMYWQVVTPHEVAHQWWGQTVGFRSYRDQWMSEGFADASASIFLQLTRPKPDDFIHFWQEERRLITEKNEFGFRPIDIGPVTMGDRLSSPRAGWNIYGDLVYPKGAYILHMIRMMMWTPQDGDARFKATMQDFAATYRMKSATTEDFKAIIEKHMAPSMDLDLNNKMDWFFREYVYGTDLPAYHFESDATPVGDGWNLHFKLTQSGVPSGFKMPVPIYVELADGKITRLGSANLIGDETVEKTLQLPQLPAPIKRVMINYYYDVLCTDD